MGRSESPVDPHESPVAQFAYDLRLLRQKAGTPTYRELSSWANFSASVLSTAARGHVLPTLPVTLAFVRACDGDVDAWQRRWHETAVEDRQPPASSPAAAPDRPDVRRFRWMWLAAALTGLAAVALLAVVPGVLARTSDRASTTLSPAVGTGGADGHACAPDGIVAPTATAGSPAQARLRMGFEPGSLPWGPYWQAKNVSERFATDDPFEGQSALRVEVRPGFTAIGTTHIADLREGMTVTVHIRYDGQGEGRLCPFVQDLNQTIQWVAVRPLEVSPRTRPGWRTYSFVTPSLVPNGVGIQINNTGATDLRLTLDAVTW
jgi:hypothetical protein